MKLLHIDSSVLGPYSVSRTLSASIAKKLGENATVTYRDVAANPIGHLSGLTLAAAMGNYDASNDEATKADLALGGEVLQEFLDSDVVVIGVGFYNFGIPSQLKAWIDRICAAGKTFKYGENGPEGLCGGKRVVVALSRGGVYSEGPAAALEHAETYLKGVFGFLGITDLEFVIAEGVNMGDEAKAAAVAKANSSIEALKAA
ncbi:FMN-dependent NADH-azoreductase [Allorhizobium terrae]|uniref:FMN dependent NADH:quinone oxidoreductase n=1 Tax=Allorhizobium terrae TaxID=1848972 RepID=A0A4S3ZPV3_9HYPH|nr:FMN-dependent NADH-azoreductase [Allorhizobium terrae]THF47553.1 FMN-dependent NADH-azoreductase [Allorhizobium terrae]TWD48279.1 FMN-dependent NADH-azoreductase [Agrobacterium vitis]